jgi:type IV pilus assembly protein PilA
MAAGPSGPAAFALLTIAPSIARGARMNALQRRRVARDEGFTLIELMVVVLIIAILIAIAIPTFIGAQNRARDRGAQSDLRNALTAGKVLATDHGGLYLDASDGRLEAADMPEGEPSITFDDATTTASPRVMFINGAADGSRVTFVQSSASGKYFGISVTSDGKVTYCAGTAQTDCDDGDDGTQSWNAAW